MSVCLSLNVASTTSPLCVSEKGLELARASVLTFVVLAPEEQIRRLFWDNFAYFSIKTYVVGTH